MTIAIVIKVTDGLVIASDSATTIGGGGNDFVYNNAEKTSNLIKGAPIGVVYWGRINIGPASFATLMKDLRKQMATGTKDQRVDPKNFTVEEVAKKVKTFFFDTHYKPFWEKVKNEKGELLPKELWPDFGMLIAGYSTNENTPEAWRLNVWAGEPKLTCDSGKDRTSDLLWGGDSEAVQRLVLGFDWRAADELSKELKLSKDDVHAAIRKVSGQIEAAIITAWMPIQDAIDLSYFLVDMSSKYSRYTPNYQTIGGPIDIAAITKYEGFKWVRRKHFYDAALNPKP